MDACYLPFSEDVLIQHFPKVKKDGEYNSNKKHLNYYRESLKRYHDYQVSHVKIDGKPIKELEKPFQVQKDERFWTVQCLLTWFYSEDKEKKLANLLEQEFGTTPPFTELNTWDECLEGELELIFEARIPTPHKYGRDWLPNNLSKQQLIPYIRSAAKGKKRSLEGPTHVDAVLVNIDNGFGIFFEAKVLSDISYQITYDTTRNQIARNIDVMLEENRNLFKPLDKRDPDKTLFILITPEKFKNKPPSRLYYYKYHEYMENPESLGEDLPHREKLNYTNIVRRIGWLTWEDFHRVDEDCCPWLDVDRKSKLAID